MIFVGINIVGIEATMRFTVAITLLSIGVLAFFFLAAIFSGKLDFNLWTNISKSGAVIPGGGGPWLPFGISGIFKSLPFAIWFFLAIEEVPLAAEESMDPRRDVPKGSVLGYAHVADRGDPHARLQHGRCRAGPTSTARPDSRCSTACTRSSDRTAPPSSSGCCS